MQDSTATPQPSGPDTTTQDPTLKEPGMDALSPTQGNPPSDATTAQMGSDAGANADTPHSEGHQEEQ